MSKPLGLVRPSLAEVGGDRDLLWLLPSPALALACADFLADEAGLVARVFEDDDGDSIVRLRYTPEQMDSVFFAIHLTVQLHHRQQALEAVLND